VAKLGLRPAVDGGLREKRARLIAIIIAALNGASDAEPAAAARLGRSFTRDAMLRSMSEVPNVFTIILNWNGLAESNWIAINDLTALIAGTSGYPPMMNGAKAFNGPLCPW